jgi:hypothetical protein
VNYLSEEAMHIENIHNFVIGTLEDNFVKTMLERACLTKSQLETLLIDFLSENIQEKKVTGLEKSRLRLRKAGVSRGAYIRTLKQAKRNVLKALSTILLLGYLGILRGQSLSTYVEVSGRVESLLEEYKKAWKENQDEETLERMTSIRNELENCFNDLI